MQDGIPVFDGMLITSSLAGNEYLELLTSFSFLKSSFLNNKETYAGMCVCDWSFNYTAPCERK